ncbi:MAG: hypothetical protein AAFY35_14845 [Pseudomonadota bacterium]
MTWNKNTSRFSLWFGLPLLLLILLPFTQMEWVGIAIGFLLPPFSYLIFLPGWGFMLVWTGAAALREKEGSKSEFLFTLAVGASLLLGARTVAELMDRGWYGPLLN